jgi:hypothetical protein
MEVKRFKISSGEAINLKLIASLILGLKSNKYNTGSRSIREISFFNNFPPNLKYGYIILLIFREDVTYYNIDTSNESIYTKR